MLRDTLEKTSKLVRKEVRIVIPAAGRAAVHGARAFLRRFPEEYAKERKKR